MRYVYVILCIIYASILASQLKGADLSYIHATCVNDKRVIPCKLVAKTDGSSALYINGKKRDDVRILSVITMDKKLALLIQDELKDKQ